MTEYWLQKKTIGGWSHVTWYADEVQATENFNRVSAGNSGFSWRVVKAETVAEKMLEEVTKIEAPEVELKASAKANVWAGQSGWGNVANKEIETIAGIPVGKEHGLSGSVWVVHHGLKSKIRVPASELDAKLAEGYVRGGPRTQFRKE